MRKIKILWVDDEIDLLKSHIIFLQQKDYEVITSNNGNDALDIYDNEVFDIVFLDENMPGLGGLDVLREIKKKTPSIPVVMITKSEEEHIMEEALGSKISDYLIKPVRPNQIILSIKKNLDTKKLISDTTVQNYQQEFREISMKLMNHLDLNEWLDLYKELTYWEIELDKSEDESMLSILESQKAEASSLFSKFVMNNYKDWLVNSPENISLSPNVIKNDIAPILKDKKTFLIVIDNLRYDQWITIKPIITPLLRVEKEAFSMSILPTATQYARNSFFAGLMPSEIKKRYPDHWIEEDEEGSKNAHEEYFLAENLKRLGVDVNFSYHKITNLAAGKKYVENLNDLANNDLNVLVYNFVDMLSHARTDMEVIRELADDEKSYRSITQSWFKNSPIYDVIKFLSTKDFEVVITTDHGTIKVDDSVKVLGDKSLNTNLRYKTGRNLTYKEKEVFELSPKEGFLPSKSMTDIFIFTKDSDFFVYPNNLNYFKKFYTNTFQHGGISMEEMLIPFIYLKRK